MNKKRIIILSTTCVAALAGAVAYASYSERDTLAKTFGENCRFDRMCKSGLHQISCRPEVDGPIHYIDPKTAEKIITCTEGRCRTADGNPVAESSAGGVYDAICEKEIVP